MKKSLIILTSTALFITGIIFYSCGKDKDADSDQCDELMDAYYNANLEFSADRTNPEKCQAFVDATENYINNCGLLTAEEKKAFQDAIDAADCSE